MNPVNLHALALTYGVVLGLIAIAETARRILRVPRRLTRKFLHIGVGTWTLPTLFLFADWRWGVVPYLSFIVLNYISYRYALFDSVEGSDNANLGSVFFPASIAILLAIFWRPGEDKDLAFIGIAGIMAMSWGDAAASIAGHRYGTRRYLFFGQARTMEGTLAMFLASGITIAPVLALMGGMGWHQSIAFALIAATVAASIESVSPYGTDNLTVPLLTAGTLYALIQISV